MLLRLLCIALATGAVGYLILCVALYASQDRLLFFPTLAAAGEFDAAARDAGFEPWTNARGERIGWKSPAHPGADALLILHGNGGHALARNYAALRRDDTSLRPPGDAPFQLFLLEYPGYGARPGPTSAETLVAAAVDGIDVLTAEDPRRRIFLFGQSLGTGIACAAAAERPERIAGLALLTPFDSLARAAGHHYPWLPVRLLLRHRLDSDRNLARYRGPVAFLVAGRDGTTPPALAERLHAIYPGPKRLWLAPEASHNDFDLLLAPWPEVQRWLRDAAS